MRVYVPSDRGYDYKPAERYGELVFLTKKPIRPLDMARMQEIWQDALHTSDPNDWIMVTSLASFLSIGCAIFARKHGRLNLLVFESGDYVGRTVQF
jgi:hypothetical protein